MEGFSKQAASPPGQFVGPSFLVSGSAIMAFAGTTQLVQGFSSDRALLAAIIPDVGQATEVEENLTWIWIDNSVYLAAQYIRRQTSRPERRVMLVISGFGHRLVRGDART